MVNIYAIEDQGGENILRIWIRADSVPKVPFIEKQLARRAQLNIASYTAQIVETHNVPIDYTNDDIPVLIHHLKTEYEFTLSQLARIILWCGERMTAIDMLTLLKRART